MALVRIVGTILQDQRNVLPVSTLLDGEYGLGMYVWACRA